MGTRSTRYVSRDTAERAIRAAIFSGKLSDDDLARMLEPVADVFLGRESYNFTVEAEGSNDDDWDELLCNDDCP